MQLKKQNRIIMCPVLFILPNDIQLNIQVMRSSGSWLWLVLLTLGSSWKQWHVRNEIFKLQNSHEVLKHYTEAIDCSPKHAKVLVVNATPSKVYVA
ncbi:hypothetical protein AHAS_Ahas08G0137800 [Arachis hypogaea]